MAFIGLDIGGTGVKAVAFDFSGNSLSSAYKEYDMASKYPGWFEFDADTIFTSALGVLKDCISECKETVDGIGVSSLGESFVLLNKRGETLAPCISYLDVRGKKYVDELSSLIDIEKYREKTGTHQRHVHSIYRLRIIGEYYPEALKQATGFHFLADYMIMKLGGGNFCDYGLAATSGAFDLNNKSWIKEIIEWTGLNPEVMPELKPAGSCLGYISDQYSEILGVKKGIPLIIGGHDHTPTSISAGLYDTSLAMNAIGTTDSWTMIAKGKESLNKIKYPTYYKLHLVEGNYIVMPAGNISGGVILKWFRDNIAKMEKQLCAEKGKNFYAEYDRTVPQKPTSIIVLPRFSSVGTDMSSSAGILNMSLSDTSEDLYRAFMEGEAFEMSTSLNEYINQVSPLSGIVAVNGGSNSETYMQIRADVFNLPVSTLDCGQPGALGDAMLVGIATGKYSDLQDAVKNCRKIKQTFIPNAENHEFYLEQYNKYIKIYDFLKCLKKM